MRMLALSRDLARVTEMVEDFGLLLLLQTQRQGPHGGDCGTWLSRSASATPAVVYRAQQPSPTCGISGLPSSNDKMPLHPQRKLATGMSLDIPKILELSRAVARIYDRNLSLLGVTSAIGDND